MAHSTLEKELKHSDSAFELGRFRFAPIDAVPSWEWLWLWARLVPWKSKRPLAAGHFGSAACGCRGSSEDVHRPEQRPLGTSKKALPTSCSTVLVPARVVQALKLNIDDMCAPQPPPPSASFQCKLQPWIWIYRIKAAAKKFVPWPIEIRFCEPSSSTNQTKSHQV
ncbi:hypothetical protein CerSpe_271470 [Prunus speciosa]